MRKGEKEQVGATDSWRRAAEGDGLRRRWWREGGGVGGIRTEKREKGNEKISGEQG